MERLTFPIIAINPSDASGKRVREQPACPMCPVFLHLSVALVQLSVHSWSAQKP